MEPRLALGLYPTLPTLDQISERLNALDAQLLELPAEVEEGTGLFALVGNDHLVLIRRTESVLPDAQTGHPLLARASAPHLKDATGMVVVITYATENLLVSPVEFARTHARLTAALVPDALAIHNTGAATTVDADVFRAAVDEGPLSYALAPVWLYEEDGRYGAYTMGLHRYGLPELQVAPGSTGPMELFQGLTQLADAALSPNPPTAGATVLLAEGEQPRTLVESTWVVGKDVPALTLPAV